MKKIKLLLTLFSIGFGTCSLIGQVTTTIDASLATYIRSGSPFNSSETEDRMLIGQFDTNTSFLTIRGVLQFDLGAIPAGATIDSVSLKLIKDAGTTGYAGTVADILVLDQGIPVYDGTQFYTNWTQVDWNKMSGGDTGGTQLATLPASDLGTWAAGGYYTLTSTAVFDDAVVNAIDNQSGILSLLMYSPDMEAVPGGANFWRVGADVAGEFPQLEVTYTPVPEPGATALMIGSATLLVLLVRRRQR